jgi:hypothetical protein
LRTKTDFAEHFYTKFFFISCLLLNLSSVIQLQRLLQIWGDHVHRMGEDRWNKMPYGLQGEALRERPQETLDSEVCTVTDFPSSSRQEKAKYSGCDKEQGTDNLDVGLVVSTPCFVFMRFRVQIWAWQPK